MDKDGTRGARLDAHEAVRAQYRVYDVGVSLFRDSARGTNLHTHTILIACNNIKLGFGKFRLYLNPRLLGIVGIEVLRGACEFAQLAPGTILLLQHKMYHGITGRLRLVNL